MNEHFIAWWNVENLFDERDAPLERRSESVRRKIIADLQNWTAAVLEQKITNLASIIRLMNDGNGPDILGVCEVENRFVLEQLMNHITIAGRNYDLIHHDMSDNRGIDVAFIYDANKYTFLENEFFNHTVIKRYPTREIIQATLRIRDSERELILLGNHWPSRTKGQYETEPYRIITAETLSYFVERIQQVKGDDAAILAMGDFNDEPTNRSLTDYALSVRDIETVRRGRKPYLYNMMWPIIGQRRASYVYDNNPIMLDQILIAKGIANDDSPFIVDDENVRLEEYEGMVAGHYHEPVRFGQRNPNLEGYSDHLPISFVLREE